MQTQPMPAHRPDPLDAGTTPPLTAPPPAAICPRCRGNLAIVRPENRRARDITARLCPSLSCGYKLIVPL
jgi:hypothetical protein